MKKIIIFIVTVLMAVGVFILLNAMGVFNTPMNHMDYVFYEDAQNLILKLEENGYIIQENRYIEEAGRTTYTFNNIDGSDYLKLQMQCYNDNLLDRISMSYIDSDKDLLIKTFDIFITEGIIADDVSGTVIYNMVNELDIPEYESGVIELEDLTLSVEDVKGFTYLKLNIK